MGGKPVFVVPNKTIINFQSGFAPKLLCDGPTFTAGTCCPYSCSFCSVPTTMRKHMPWMRKHGVTGKHEDIVVRRGNAVEIVRRQLTDHKGNPKFLDWNDQRVIYASPLVDVAGNMELVRETVAICKEILNLTEWQIRLLSKSNLLPKIAIGLSDAGLPLCSRERVIYGVSTGTLDDGLAKAFEQGTPLVSKRTESLHWLQDNGYRTFGMICPSLPQHDYDKFAREMAAAIRWERCEHVWAEVINARGESFRRTYDSLALHGFSEKAAQFKTVSTNPLAWEKYARDTFEAHAKIYGRSGKLRFLQYVTNGTRDFWESQSERGAICL